MINNLLKLVPHRLSHRARRVFLPNDLRGSSPYQLTLIRTAKQFTQVTGNCLYIQWHNYPHLFMLYVVGETHPIRN